MCTDTHGCGEYQQLSRRRFLGLSGGLAASALVPSWLPRVALADTENSARDVLVSIFLRGGSDALTLCPPFFEPNYYRLRPTLAIPPPDSLKPGRALDLDGRFGLPPAMAPLLDPFRDQALAIVHACGFDNPTRSHFAAMHFMEVGQAHPPTSLFSGWLGRHLQTTPPLRPDALLRAVGLNVGLPRTLLGAPQTLPIPDLEAFGFSGPPASAAARRQALAALYADAEPMLQTSATNTLGTIDLLEQIDFAGYRPAGGALYPADDFGTALRSSAALIKAEIGVEAVAIDLGGWDTHEFQGPLDGGMAQLMQSFAGGLAAFYQDLWSSNFTRAGAPRVIVIALSEFGRNASENASKGSDHGHGGLMFVLGSGVLGGRVISEWPGLEREQLYDGQDLAITIDYRDVLSEILARRLATPDVRAVFSDPSYRPVARGVIA